MNNVTTVLITALLVMVMAGPAMCATPVLMEAPRNDAAPTEPVIIDGHVCGFIPPAHVTLQEREVGYWETRMGAAQSLPPVWDWRDQGMVSAVKNQGQCGSCYAFAFASQVESLLMIAIGGEVNLSENDLKEKNQWQTVNYGCPDCRGSCNGGDAYICMNEYSRWGSVNETDDPYAPWDVSQWSRRAPPQDVFTEWHQLGSSTPPNPVIKAAVMQQPVYTTIDATCLSGYTSGVITSGPDDNNHAVMIVGWNDSTYSWICKNSWGDDWGEEGFFRVKYGVAGIGKYTSYVTEWHAARADERLYHNDEAGWRNSWGWTGCNYTEMLVEYTPGLCENATSIEFWATDGCIVEAALYDSFDGQGLGNVLPNSEVSEVYESAGYYSIEFEYEVPLIDHIGDGEPVYVYVVIDGPNFPMPTDGDVGPQETIGKQWTRLPSGSWGEWDTTNCGDLGVRMRTVAFPLCPVPEISTLAAVGLGICMIGIFARRKP